MIDFEQLKIESKGKWPSIYYQLGIDVGEGKHKPCPSCGGSDRFRFDDRYGMGDYFCGQCGAGDGFSLVMKCLSIDFPEALEKIQSIAGGCKVETQKEKPAYDIKKMLNSLWSKSNVLTGSDPVSLYLHSRGLVLQPDNVRHCPACYESDSKTEQSAMVARIVDKNNVPLALHRTYLSSEHRKADIKSPKKMTPALGSLTGCAVRLFSPESSLFESGILGIAEGIETAISATQLSQIATWAAISTSLMESWLPPENIKNIIIFIDNDSNYAGQKSAYILANRLYNKDLLVEVQMPHKKGTDFNDVLKNA